MFFTVGRRRTEVGEAQFRRCTLGGVTERVPPPPTQPPGPATNIAIRMDEKWQEVM